jgi:hypothetical protein
MMGQFSNFTSLPPEQEATFNVYEERISAATRSGVMAGLIAGVGLGFFVLVVAFTVTPEKPKDYSGDPGSQTQKAAPSNTVKADTAPTPTPPPSEAPAAEAPPPEPSPTTPPPSGAPPGINP